eukprot:TRINITY_DN96380_c0_g1_i1.p1 TRINITY_DN96380_c0_g1~~TRINITY_DN96380_c0_g1_i1.p1  ORF type:complete len:347 (+),score=64.76 TRINITY_DN96380_c0_g1_i1:24-1043(+)
MDVDAEVECAICYETITEPTALPCACNVSYCPRCWDRSLASSFNSGDRARCPTCRSPVRVDFDSNTCRLVFSRESDDAPPGAHDEGAEAEGRLLSLGSEAVAMQAVLARYLASHRPAEEAMRRRKETIDRLVEQAVPAMTRLLDRFRRNHETAIAKFIEQPTLALDGIASEEIKKEIADLGGIADDCTDKTKTIQRFLDFAQKGAVSSFLVSHQLEAPPCVCGNVLERVTSKERARRYLSKKYTQASVEQALERLQSSTVVCDLCDGKIPMKTFIWTCKNEDSTILHATTYDICDGCFGRHVCGVISEPGFSQAMASRGSEVQGGDAMRGADDDDYEEV